MIVLGISALYHDSAAALVLDGNLVAAAQEERFTRVKADQAFPTHALRYCLDTAKVGLSDVDYVAFYDKPLLTFDRLLETYLSFAPRGLPSLVMSMPVWAKEKIMLQRTLTKALNGIDRGKFDTKRLLFSHHHHSHAASAFYPSPFDDAAILILDGVGEWATMSIGRGRGNDVQLLHEVRFPHSLGMLYSAFTYYLGFKINDGEYKIMGLAPYGEPKYADRILDKVMDLKPDGSFRLDMRYFNYCTGLTMTAQPFHDLFEGAPLKSGARLGQREMDLARSVQAVTEEVMLRLCRTAHSITGSENLVMAGGVALNCVANGRLQREGPFRRIWIQPAAGDAGGAIGAAFAAAASNGTTITKRGGGDAMQGSYLGPSYSDDEIRSELKANGAVFHELSDDALFDTVAAALAGEQVVGWFQGRMEFGPRALGNRSILGDPRSPRMQRILNLKIKYRESFRPFAPAVLADRASQYFELDVESPYMLLVAKVKEERQRKPTAAEETLEGIAKLNVVRSDIPAVTHVDYSARVQTVDGVANPRFHRLLTAFERKTGCAVLVNTSFNIRDEPIVCSPTDAYRCFLGTEMDMLVVGNAVMRKSEQW